MKRRNWRKVRREGFEWWREKRTTEGEKKKIETKRLYSRKREERWEYFNGDWRAKNEVEGSRTNFI